MNPKTGSTTCLRLAYTFRPFMVLVFRRFPVQAPYTEVEHNVVFGDCMAPLHPKERRIVVLRS